MAVYTLIPFDAAISNNPELWPEGTKMQGTTFTLNDGDVLNANASSWDSAFPTTINGGDFVVNIQGDVPSGTGNIFFGADSTPEVNIAANSDASALTLNGGTTDDLDVSVGEGSQLGRIFFPSQTTAETTSIDLGDGATVRAISGGGNLNLTGGNDVSIPQGVLAAGGNVTMDVGNGFSSGPLTFSNTSSGTSTNVTLGDNADVSSVFTGGVNDSFTAGDGLTTGASITIYGEESSTVNVGNGATIGALGGGFVSSGPGRNDFVFGDDLTASGIYAYDYVDSPNGDPDAPNPGSSIVIGSGADLYAVSTLTSNSDAETSISIGPDSSVSGYIQGGSGTDSITVAENSDITSIYTLAGEDSVEIAENTTVGILNTGSGGDTVFTAGSIGSTGSTGGGVNTLYLREVVDLNDVHIYNGDSDLVDDGDTLNINILEEQIPAFLSRAEFFGWTYDAEAGRLTGGLPFTYGLTSFSGWDAINLICFTSGTLILTPAGEVPIEDLSVGDLVRTADRGDRAIRWIGSRKLDAVDLRAHPKLRPIRIRAGALGDGQPRQDLLVSPQHRMLVSSKIAQNMFGTDEVLAAAKQLILVEGIDIADDIDEVTYVHFLCDDHEIVWANGARSESLYTGEEALKSVGPKARSEIFAIFPELKTREAEFKPESARALLTGRQARKLADRHARKKRNLIE